jgi:hypothetical protein
MVVGPAPVMPSWRRSLVMRPVADNELDRFRAELQARHWLGFRLSGQVMRYVAARSDCRLQLSDDAWPCYRDWRTSA